MVRSELECHWCKGDKPLEKTKKKKNLSSLPSWFLQRARWDQAQRSWDSENWAERNSAGPAWAPEHPRGRSFSSCGQIHWCPQYTCKHSCGSSSCYHGSDWQPRRGVQGPPVCKRWTSQRPGLPRRSISHKLFSDAGISIIMNTQKQASKQQKWSQRVSTARRRREVGLRKKKRKRKKRMKMKEP